MKRTPSWIGSGSLVLEFLVLQFVSEQGTRDVNAFTSDDSDMLAVQDLLGNNRCKATEKVALPVDDQFLLKHLKGNYERI